jgi:hypothetical protein
VVHLGTPSAADTGNLKTSRLAGAELDFCEAIQQYVGVDKVVVTKLSFLLNIALCARTLIEDRTPWIAKKHLHDLLMGS